MRIAAETAADRTSVHTINAAAFGQQDEAELVESLHADGDVVLSLVAFVDGKPVGHILFSRLALTVNGKPVKAVALAPMAVLPSHQKQGIGQALMHEGLARLRDMRIAAVIVLGHEAYYPRYGFRHDLVAGINCPFTEYQAFMGLELAPGCLGGKAGACAYAEAFGLG